MVRSWPILLKNVPELLLLVRRAKNLRAVQLLLGYYTRPSVALPFVT